MGMVVPPNVSTAETKLFISSQERYSGFFTNSAEQKRTNRSVSFHGSRGIPTVFVGAVRISPVCSFSLR